MSAAAIITAIIITIALLSQDGRIMMREAKLFLTDHDAWKVYDAICSNRNRLVKNDGYVKVGDTNIAIFGMWNYDDEYEYSVITIRWSASFGLQHIKPQPRHELICSEDFNYLVKKLLGDEFENVKLNN